MGLVVHSSRTNIELWNIGYEAYHRFREKVKELIVEWLDDQHLKQQEKIKKKVIRFKHSKTNGIPLSNSEITAKIQTELQEGLNTYKTLEKEYKQKLMEFVSHSDNSGTLTSNECRRWRKVLKSAHEQFLSNMLEKFEASHTSESLELSQFFEKIIYGLDYCINHKENAIFT